MSAIEVPAVARLAKLRTRLTEGKASDGEVSLIDELGINMVDLMMWLVIATLLLAAALQGIGYYQRASWTYQARSDVASVRTYMEAQYTLNNNAYPVVGTLWDGRATTQPTAAPATTDVKLTGKNKATVVTSTPAGWSAQVESDSLQVAGNPFTFAFSSTGDNNVSASGTSTSTW